MAYTSNSPESQSTTPQPEQFPLPPEAVPEQAGEFTPEVHEVQAEKRPEKSAEQSAPVLPPVVDPQADTGQSDDSQVADDQVASSMPLVADDVDVIEKAWVDKAKQIIKETQDDPRAQEQQFEQLQIEYHKKRYGRDIKAKR